jgi:tRNA(Ile)-lysidine synthase
MQNILEFIKENKLIKKGQVIGVGVSGGSDSMALVHYLSTLQDELDCEIVAIHVDHSIREESREEADFVIRKCKEMGIRAYKFKIDAPKLAKERNESLETAARTGRYEVFESLIKRDVIDVVALAHHQSDQVETILMHIFRGSGVAGARGMEPIRDKKYIRPMLNTTKKAIIDYVNYNGIDYVTDQSNFDNAYNRNYLRNKLMPEILERWPGAEQAIINFGKAVTEDDNYINTHIHDDAVIYENKKAFIPVSYLMYHSSVASRMIIKSLKKIGLVKDFEKKHIDMIKELAHGTNGQKIALPCNVTAIKEYDYVTLLNTTKEVVKFDAEFKCGDFEVPTLGRLVVKRVKDFTPERAVLFIDYRKVPKTARWRFRQDGDVFTKFGGGTKKLASYLIDRKVPARLRNYLPVLADGNEILVVAGVEISEKVKMTGEPTAFRIELKPDNK